MWYVSSRSGVATLRTAIHLLFTYLLTYLHSKWSKNSDEKPRRRKTPLKVAFSPEEPTGSHLAQSSLGPAESTPHLVQIGFAVATELAVMSIRHTDHGAVATMDLMTALCACDAA